MSRFRQRKLNTKTPLSILREADVEGLAPANDAAHTSGVGTPADTGSGAETRGDALTSLPKVETGVELKEEKEHHLQAVINASHRAAVGGKVAQIYIPTPDAVLANIQYDDLYPKSFAQPATYIRFSSTVEDSIGCPYCMSEDDEAFLKTINTKKGKTTPCTEDQFEIVMNVFEEVSAAKQPFAAVDNTPVLEFDEMESAFDESVEDVGRKFAKDIYEYWKKMRIERGNHSLMAKLKTLKIDSGQEADDSDPYVCFRRREVRQVRKTRGRDAQVVEKLKKLRKELEEARQLLDLVKRREQGRKEDLSLSREIYDQRASVREMKRTLNIPDEDDELLITQKSPKKRPAEPLPQPAKQPLRLAHPRTDGFAPPEMTLTLLSDKLARRDEAISQAISNQVEKHDHWNTRFIDRTLDAALGLYSPAEDESAGSDFVAVKAGYTQLPTPPASVAAESPTEDSQSPPPNTDNVIFKFSTPSSPENFDNVPRFRRRVGRGGRMMLDRHNFKTKNPKDIDSVTWDRFKYDHEDGDQDMFRLPDAWGATMSRYRAHWNTPRDQQQAQIQAAAQRRASGNQRDVSMTNGQSTAGSTGRS